MRQYRTAAPDLIRGLCLPSMRPRIKSGAAVVQT
jgi:hypothetical protein